jgi:hypothetical protein
MLRPNNRPPMNTAITMAKDTASTDTKAMKITGQKDMALKVMAKKMNLKLRKKTGESQLSSCQSLQVLKPVKSKLSEWTP